MSEQQFESHYDEAMRMLSNGYDNTYIELQFIEQGVDKETISRVLKKIGSVRKSDQRRGAVKLIVGGLATVAVGIIFTLISYSSDSPAVYVLYGLITVGFMTFAKGIIDLM